MDSQADQPGTKSAARAEQPAQQPEVQAAQPRRPQDTSLAAYAKWSALMIAVVLGFGFLAAQLLRWLDIDLGR
ncbi:MAG: hypothetical protein ACKO4Q_19335 [Planctomycetota bacterium]